MHSTKDATLQLIQREISEVVQRENELKELYSQLDKTKITTNGVPKTNHTITNGKCNSPLRLFTQNPSSKGAMHRFIKSRGKISNITPVITPKARLTSWTHSNMTELGKPVIPVGAQPRKGFVPIEERLRNEFHEMEKRESELIIQRAKSQPDLLALFNSDSPEPSLPVYSPSSVSLLSDGTYDNVVPSPSPTLKSARSLADLCDIEDEEVAPPGSVNLIKRWEGIIQQNHSKRL